MDNDKPKSIKEWMGSGAGTIIFPPDYDPHEPAVPAEDWEALKDDDVKES